MGKVRLDIKITTIDLLRHGDCVDGKCYRGSTDVALSYSGFQKMEQSLKSLIKKTNDDGTGWQRVVTSPLIRCLGFAKQFSSEKGLPLLIEPDFKEMHFGKWEGKLIQAVWESQPDEVSAWVADPIASPPPEGEAADVFAKRVIEAFEQLIVDHAGERMLLVSHGGVMRVLLTHCLAMPLLELNRFDIPYACLSRIQIVTDQGRNYYRLLTHNLS
ncbi:MAG: broad specificity phosphatase PhoE [Cellvibrionaceae bacterium]|jgi:broad specificity phosphatase PhoE